MTVFLPNQNWTTAAVSESPVAPRDTLNASAANIRETQLSIAAENAPLRVLYGTVRIGPQIANVLAYAGNLVILCIWGHGEIDSIDSYTIDDKAVASGVTATHYTGTAGQTVNGVADDAVNLAMAPNAQNH